MKNETPKVQKSGQKSELQGKKTENWPKKTEKVKKMREKFGKTIKFFWNFSGHDKLKNETLKPDHPEKWWKQNFCGVTQTAKR